MFYAILLNNSPVPESYMLDSRLALRSQGEKKRFSFFCVYQPVYSLSLSLCLCSHNAPKIIQNKKIKKSAINVPRAVTRHFSCQDFPTNIKRDPFNKLISGHEIEKNIVIELIRQDNVTLIGSKSLGNGAELH